MRVAFLLLACLPSLRPVGKLISDKFKQLRKHKIMHKRSSKSLTDKLNPGNATTVLPLSKKKNWWDGQRSMLDSSSMIEMEAKAPGCSDSEIETIEPAFHI